MAESTQLHPLLTSAVNGAGVASLSIIETPGATPHTFWVPEPEQEPAFLAYSITKTFTATLVLRLCEEGQLRLDDRLAKWFPQVAHADRISLTQLLNHTSGIPDYGGLPAYHEAVRASSSTPWSFDTFAAETFDKGLWFEPGTGWGYSNPAYMLLKRIVETVTGLSYRSLIAQRIVQPLGLTNTFVAESLDDLAALAPGTSRALSVDGTPRDVRANYHPGWVSHGVIASTASDVVRFFDALFGAVLLSPHSLARMMELVPVPMRPSESIPRRGKPSYGLGLMGDPDSPWGLVAGHNGGGPCYKASAFHAFDLGGASVCVMGAIEDDFDAEHVVSDVFDHLAIALQSFPKNAKSTAPNKP